MRGVFFKVVEGDCRDISYTLDEKGLLNFEAPKGYSDKELINFLKCMDKTEYRNIIETQKKATEEFRKAVYELMEKYRKELNINFHVALRIQTNSKKLIDFRVEVRGITFSGNMMLVSHLQYVPFDLIEKLVKGAVLGIGIEYEDICSRITGRIVCDCDFVGFEPPVIKKATSYKFPEEDRYHVNMDKARKTQIINEGTDAYKEILELQENEKYGIISQKAKQGLVK